MFCCESESSLFGFQKCLFFVVSQITNAHMVMFLIVASRYVKRQNKSL